MTTIDDLIAAHLADGVGPEDMDRQLITWHRPNWAALWESADLPAAATLDSIDVEVDAYGTIRRSWVRGLADGDPLEFLVASTIWGYGNYVRRGRSALRRMLTSPGVDRIVTEIIGESGIDAGRGFNSLFDARGRTRISSLGIAFGTKVVHFAGYGHADPSPLVLDARVFATASKLQDGTRVPDPRTYTKGSEYRDYCAWAGDAAARNDVTAEYVEFTLFARNGKL